MALAMRHGMAPPPMTTLTSSVEIRGSRQENAVPGPTRVDVRDHYT